MCIYTCWYYVIVGMIIDKEYTAVYSGYIGEGLDFVTGDPMVMPSPPLLNAKGTMDVQYISVLYT